MKEYDDGEVYLLLVKNGLEYLPSEIIERGLQVDDFADIENIECEGNEITGHCLIECTRDGLSANYNSDFVMQLDDTGEVTSVEFLELNIEK